MFQARVNQDAYQSMFLEGDLVAVTGAVQAADGRPYLVAVRLEDGAVDLVMAHNITATEIVWPDGQVSCPPPTPVQEGKGDE